jgi:nucleotide-binding universal stress UspA family protein
MRESRICPVGDADVPGASAADDERTATPEKELVMFDTVVLALDGSPESLAAASYARELVGEHGAIRAVHVREIMLGRGGGQPANANEDEIVADVRRTVEELKAGGADISLEVATAASGGPAQVIAEIARRSSADVIVMGTRGRGQVAGLLLGSVTQRLLHLAHCPVFAVPPGAVSKTAEAPAAGAAAGA